MSKSFKITMSIIILSVVLFFGFFYGNLFVKSYEFKEKIRKSICDVKKGEWVISGCGLSRCTNECLYKYKDAGKSCTNSSQCQGDCVVFSPKISFFTEKDIIEKFKDCQKIEPDEHAYRCDKMEIVARCEETPQKCFDSTAKYEDGLLILKSRSCPSG